jgi:hypothetical protein
MANTEELIAALARDTTPARQVSHPYLLGAKWMAVSLVYLALTLVYSGLRADLLLKLHAPLFLVEIGALAGIVGAGSLSAALLAFPDLHQRRTLAYVPVILLAALAGLVFLAWQADSPPAPRPAHDVECLLCIASYTLLPATWMFYALRKYASTHYYLAGAITLLTSFSLGALSLRLSEQTDSIVHVIQWHYLPMIGVALMGLWLGRQLLKW